MQSVCDVTQDVDDVAWLCLGSHLAGMAIPHINLKVIFVIISADLLQWLGAQSRDTRPNLQLRRALESGAGALNLSCGDSP